MKVLYFLPGTGVGGIGKFVKDIVSKTAENIDYTFVTLGNPGTELALFLKDNGKFVNYPRWGRDVLKGIYHELNKNNYDVIHAHLGCWSFIVLGVARICRVKKRIAHTHSADSFQTLSGFSKVIYMLSRILNPLVVTKYLACSDHAGKSTFGKKVVLSEKYTRILNPVDDRFLQNKKEPYIRKEFKIPESAKLICHVGYMGYHKNHPFILSLAENMKSENVYWILVGDGKKRAEFEKIVQKNNLDKVIFAGIRSDIPAILDESNVFILPSLLEGLGTVVLEAQARGKKCIISENVTNEVDMGIGLIKQIPLSDSSSWEKEILSNVSDYVDLKKIRKIYINNKVEISACSMYLVSLYS